MDFTTRLGLSKPDGDPVTGDVVDIDVLNANFDALDAVVSFTPCLSTARPSAPFVGQGILETDTADLFVWGGSAWLPLLGGSAQFTNIGLGTAPDANPARRIRSFWGGTNGALSQVLIEQSGAASGSRAFAVKAGGEANERFSLDFDGKMQWGPGTTGFDVTVNRVAGAILDISNGSLTVNGFHPMVPMLAKYPTAGSFTWTKPAKARWVRVKVCGGGGGGAGSTAPASGAHSKGGGGGGGAYAEKWFDANDLTATVPITVGGGGTGNTAANGAGGGTSYFGPTATPYLSAGGGSGGFYGSSSTATYEKNGGPGGSAFSGSPDLSVVGGMGGKGGGGITLGSGGVGGSSFLGGGGAGAETTSSSDGIAGGNAVGIGGGGGGAASSSLGAAAKGGNGAAGIVIVETYF